MVMTSATTTRRSTVVVRMALSQIALANARMPAANARGPMTWIGTNHETRVSAAAVTSPPDSAAARGANSRPGRSV